MSQSNPGGSAPRRSAPSRTRSGGPLSNSALGLEPTTLERELSLGADSPRPAREARRSRVAVRLLLASLPVFGIPACMADTDDPATTVGLDNGTVGMSDAPSVTRLRDAA